MGKGSGIFDSLCTDAVLKLGKQVFTPGEVLTGTFFVSNTSNISYVAIRVEIKGLEHAHTTRRVTRGSGKHRHTHTEHYHQESLFFHHHIVVAGQTKRSGKRETLTLGEGKHQYGFEYQLPYNVLPSVFAGQSNAQDNVSVQYTVRAYIDIPYGSDVEKIASFAVAPMPMPIGQYHANPSPQKAVSAMKVTTCCCFDGGVVEELARTSRSLLLIGRDATDVVVALDNSNGRNDISSARVSIQQRSTITAQSCRVTPIKEVSFVNLPLQLGAGQKTEKTVKLSVPRGAPPTYNGYCAKIDYCVVVTFDVEWASGEPTLIFPLFVVAGLDETNQMPPIPMGAGAMPPPLPRFGTQQFTEEYNPHGRLPHAPLPPPWLQQQQQQPQMMMAPPPQQMMPPQQQPGSPYGHPQHGSPYGGPPPPQQEQPYPQQPQQAGGPPPPPHDQGQNAPYDDNSEQQHHHHIQAV